MDQLFRECNRDQRRPQKDIQWINLDGIGGSTGDRALVLDWSVLCVLDCWTHEEINIHITYLLNARVQSVFRLERKKAQGDDLFL